MRESIIVIDEEKLHSLISKLSLVFESVHLTDPAVCRGFIAVDDGTMVQNDDYCYGLFDRVGRCEPCAGLEAQKNCRSVVKLENAGNERRLLLATPIAVISPDGSRTECVLEAIMSGVSEILSGVYRGQHDRHKMYIDGLTGAYNRLYFEEYAFASKEACETVFVMTDIRDFKSINDTYGHPVGDVALRKTVAVMKTHIRATDKVIRMGGDEFLIILFRCSEAGAWNVIRKIREGLREDAMYDEKRGLHTYVNCGVSHSDSFDGSPELSRRMYAEADRKMYQDKNSRQ